MSRGRERSRKQIFKHHCTRLRAHSFKLNNMLTLNPMEYFCFFEKKRFSFSSSPNSFLITTFSELFLATKTKPQDPRPIASSLSRNCSHANNGKLWQSRDPSELYFPFRKSNLNTIELTICFWHLVEKKFLKLFLTASANFLLSFHAMRNSGHAQDPLQTSFHLVLL